MNAHTRKVLANERTSALKLAEEARAREAKAKEEVATHARVAERFEAEAAQLTTDLVAGGGIPFLATQEFPYAPDDPHLDGRVDDWLQRELLMAGLQLADPAELTIERHRAITVRTNPYTSVSATGLAVPR